MAEDTLVSRSGDARGPTEEPIASVSDQPRNANGCMDAIASVPEQRGGNGPIEAIASVSKEGDANGPMQAIASVLMPMVLWRPSLRSLSRGMPMALWRPSLQWPYGGHRCLRAGGWQWPMEAIASVSQHGDANGPMQKDANGPVEAIALVCKQGDANGPTQAIASVFQQDANDPTQVIASVSEHADANSPTEPSVLLSCAETCATELCELTPQHRKEQCFPGGEMCGEFLLTEGRESESPLVTPNTMKHLFGDAQQRDEEKLEETLWTAFRQVWVSAFSINLLICAWRCLMICLGRLQTTSG